MTVSLPAFLRTSMIGPCTALLLPYGGQAHAQNTACQPLLPEKNKNIALSQTGSYCLQADLEIRDHSEFFIDTPFYWYRSPDPFETTRLQMAALGERPATVLFSFGPFILANTWYLARLLTAPSSTSRHRIP